MCSRLVIVVLTVMVTQLAGCSYLKENFKYPNVHKLRINQGNVINQQVIDQLRPGLSRSQVRYILGTPLIADTFSQSRWDYYYSLKLPGFVERRERVSVYFTDDKLTHFIGSYRPSSLAALDAAGASEADTDDTIAGSPNADQAQPPESYPVESSTLEIDSEAADETPTIKEPKAE